MAKMKPSERKMVEGASIDQTPDPWGRAGYDKRALRTSTQTTLRRREPVNPKTAEMNPNMVWDYSKQRKVWPNTRPNALIESTHGQPLAGSEGYDTMNRSGRPYALGEINVGGAPDDAGIPLRVQSRQKKMLK